MQDLIQLIKLLTKQKTNQIEILTEGSEIPSKARLLFEGIQNGNFVDDKSAALSIYNSDEKSSAYVKLKYRLKQRLLNTIFFIDIQKYSRSSYEKALAHSYKNWAASKILLRKGLNSLAVEISETVLKQTLKYDIIELSLLITADLKLHYGLMRSNKSKFEKYTALNKSLISQFQKRDVAQAFYIKYGKLVTNKKSIEDQSKFDIDLEEINDLINDPFKNDFYSNIYLFNSAYFINLIKKDIKQQYEISMKAMEYFEAKPEYHKRGLFDFKQKLGISLLGMKKSKEAIVQFNDCLSFGIEPGRIGWQFIHSYLFTAHIISGDFNESYKVLNTVMDHPKFKTTYPKYKEPWFLKEAIINFLVRKNKIDLDHFESIKLRPFRINRFLNEVPEMTKDKKGLNVTIHIIEILFLLIDEEYDKVLDRLSALKQYSFRYLKKPRYARSSNFIKMLLKIPAGNYNAALIQKKAAKYHNFLKANPMEYSEQSLNIEIIPYEQLWEEVLGIFDKSQQNN